MADSIKHANIGITNQCNQKCFYCFSNSGQARKDELSLDTWLEVLNIMKISYCDKQIATWKKAMGL